MITEACAGGAAGAPKWGVYSGRTAFDKRFYQGTVAAKMLLREARRIAVAERSSKKIRENKAANPSFLIRSFEAKLAGNAPAKRTSSLHR
jgi:hypothetical protein